MAANNNHVKYFSQQNLTKKKTGKCHHDLIIVGIKDTQQYMYVIYVVV